MAEGWRFEFEGRDCTTVGKLGDMLCEIAKEGDLARAGRFVADYTDAQMQAGKTRQEAIDIVRSNIGYVSGYYSPETMARIQGVFAADHPIFGRATPSQTQDGEA